MKREIITFRDPKSPLSEVFRTLRTNIQFTNMNKTSNVILITSSAPGEGKSWTASNLAVTFAQAENKVLLIDGDMRKGRVYNLFDVSPIPGLSNLLAEVGEHASIDDLGKYIQRTDVDNLFIITAGTVPPNPSELLVKRQAANMLDKLREVFDVIIIDGTPCSLVTDSVILSRIVDSTIVVAAHAEAKRDDLKNTIKMLQNVGAHIAGVVFNKMPRSKKRYNKSYYYYGGSSLSTKVDKKKKKSGKSSKTQFYAADMKELKKAMKENNEKEPDTNTDEILSDVKKYIKK